EAIHRPVDVVITNMTWPSPNVLGRYALEHKEPLAPGPLPAHCELVGGSFWTSEIARHDRLRLAYAVWSVLSRGLLNDALRVFLRFVLPRFRGCFFVVSSFRGRLSARPAFNVAARSIIFASMAPASPPFAGRLDRQIAGVSAARISSNSPSLLTL